MRIRAERSAPGVIIRARPEAILAGVDMRIRASRSAAGLDMRIRDARKAPGVAFRARSATILAGELLRRRDTSLLRISAECLDRQVGQVADPGRLLGVQNHAPKRHLSLTRAICAAARARTNGAPKPASASPYGEKFPLAARTAAVRCCGEFSPSPGLGEFHLTSAPFASVGEGRHIPTVSGGRAGFILHLTLWGFRMSRLRGQYPRRLAIKIYDRARCTRTNPTPAESCLHVPNRAKSGILGDSESSPAWEVPPGPLLRPRRE